jgi:formylglycine-generating enzyme required for sulfatase activity
MKTEVKKYDVFISSKSEDYPLAREIYAFLKGSGYTVFFAENSIPLGADSIFKKTIDSALDGAQNMIVVCSDPAYLQERWVHYEWNTFAVEILSGRKKNGNILTIVNSSVSINDLPIGLRSAQTLQFDSYKDTLCKYISGLNKENNNEPSSEKTLEANNSQHTQRRTLWWTIGSIIVVIALAAIGYFGWKSNDISHEQSYTNNQTYLDFSVGNVSFRMVLVKGGTFTMGATAEQGTDATNDELPVRSVTLSDYYIGETEVTQALWKAVMGNNPSCFVGTENPVDSVTWDECIAFIDKLNQLTKQKFRLPTEAEWEYAARGGCDSKGYKYSGSNDINEVAWNQDNCDNTTHPVKLKQANELGLYDMSGNVYEWCQDWFDTYTTGACVNPQGPSSGIYRVLRGASWYNYAWRCRVSYRRNCAPMVTFYNVGLRLAL